MQRKKTVLIIIVLALVLGAFVGSGFMGYYVFTASTRMRDNEETSLEKMENWLQEKEDFDLARFRDNYNIETVKIDSSSGEHKIPADHITAKENQNDAAVIMVHGLGGNRLSVYPQAEIFLENGFDVLAYDQRSSGENFAPHNTYGYLESNDLEDYVKYMREHPGQYSKLGVWGLSFGGATAGIYAGTEHANQNIDFAILDSPLSSMRYVITEEIEQMTGSYLAQYLIFMGNLINHLQLGFTYDDANVARAIENTEVPVMLIHSQADNITPYFMGEDIYKAVKHDHKEFFSVENSEHGEIHLDYPQEYADKMIKFIQENE